MEGCVRSNGARSGKLLFPPSVRTVLVHDQQRHSIQLPRFLPFSPEKCEMIRQDMSRYHRFNAIMFAACALAIGSLTACSIGDPSAGSPYPGPSSSPPTPPPKQACSTGTQLALVDPLPGAHVMATTRPIKIVSNHVISDAQAALALKILKGATTSPRPLFGPIRKPKHSPTPFPRNVYYEARGFELQPSKTYKVELASIKSDCKPDAIGGAIFKTGH
jgi:hypothetical protein